MVLKPDETLLGGKYRIGKILGKGGFGFFYLAQETTLNKERAIKELIPALVGDEALLKRFLAEAEATMRLTHEGIARTYDLFREGDHYYIVMEYLPGGSLEDRLREQDVLPASEALRIASDVCEGLGYAHRRGAVHCDLKPANILFAANGSAKVADFGIAHFSQEMLTHSWKTPTDFVAGTLPYMSPEQTAGVRDEPRIDVYSLGAVIYRMLAGRTYLDFDERETPLAQAENVQRICNEQPLPPSTYRRDIPGWLDETVLKALEKQPEGRYASMDDFQAALGERGPSEGQALRTEGLSTLPHGSQLGPTPAVQSRRRAMVPDRVGLLAGGTVALLAVVVVLSLLIGRGDGRRATPEPSRNPLIGAPAAPTTTPTSGFTSGLASTPAATVESGLAPVLATPGPMHTGVPPLPVQAYVLPDNEPHDVAFDGSALWVLFWGNLVRLEPVESEGRFREAERLPFDASDVAGAGSPGQFWAILGSPADGTLRLVLVDVGSSATVEYAFPKAFDGYPGSVAWDGEFVWVTTGGRLFKLRPAGDGAELTVVDSYALDVGQVETPETGLTWDGEALWVLVWDQLARLDRSARPTCTLQLSSNFDEYHLYSGLAWDGRFLWATDFHTGKIYRADPAACQTPG